MWWELPNYNPPVIATSDDSGLAAAFEATVSGRDGATTEEEDQLVDDRVSSLAAGAEEPAEDEEVSGVGLDGNGLDDQVQSFTT